MHGIINLLWFVGIKYLTHTHTLNYKRIYISVVHLTKHHQTDWYLENESWHICGSPTICLDLTFANPWSLGWSCIFLRSNTSLSNLAFQLNWRILGISRISQTQWVIKASIWTLITSNNIFTIKRKRKEWHG